MRKTTTFQKIPQIVGIAGDTGLCYHPRIGDAAHFVVSHVASGARLPVGVFESERAAQQFIGLVATFSDWTQPRSFFMVLPADEKDALRTQLKDAYERFYLIAPAE